MSKQDKYTRSAKGQPCTVRIPGVCKPAPENETTVLAHLNGYGMGGKHLSIHGAYACAECHRWLDYEWTKQTSKHHRDEIHLWAVIETQQIMVKEGILEL